MDITVAGEQGAVEGEAGRNRKERSDNDGGQEQEGRAYSFRTVKYGRYLHAFITCRPF